MSDQKDKPTRREFFAKLGQKAAIASPLAAAAGTRFHSYAHAARVGYRGRVEVWGRLVGFVGLDGKFLPFRN